jgi:Tol biopolymer transport system component/DNA-binding winged helix-turn-helix (wHTH) protein
MRALARYSILSSAPMYRFGVFELHPQRGELRKHGFPVRLAPQPFQLLTILLEHPGELVSREELRARLWDHDGTTVEFDACLNRCIRQIRAVLTDDAEAPRYIETAPRKGYRFIAPVEQLTVKKEDVSAASVAGLAEPKAVSHRMPVWRVAAATFLALALAASVTLWVSSRPKLSADLNIVPLAVALGHQFAPAFSPDGRQVAFVWDGESRNNFDIYIKIIGSSSAPLRLTTSEDIDYSPAWSPDGRWIAFCRGADSRGGAIFVVSALGGVERKVIDLDTPGAPANRSISWSSNSESLVVACRLAHKTEKGLYVVNVETGEPHRLTTPGPDEEDLSPAVSPDGRMIAFTRDTARGVSSIMLLPFGGAQSPRTLPGPVSGGQPDVYNGRPAWTPDGSHLVFASNAGGNQHLWLVSARGSGPPLDLRALGGGAQDAALSATGRLALTREISDSNIWKVDLRGLPDIVSFRPARIAASTMVEQNPAISPDGQRIAFESSRSGFTEIWTARADGSDPMQITSLQNPVTGSPDWSPDGRRIVFDSRTGGRAQIYTVLADGGKPERLTSGSASSVVPRWSADAQSIYYSSDQSGRMEIWRMPASGGAAQQVTVDGGFAPAPSRDGESLYYRSSNAVNSSLWELRLATGKRMLISASVRDRAFAAAPGGVYFFVDSHREPKDKLFFFDKRSRRTMPLFETEKRVGSGMVLAPDGHTLYYTQWDDDGHELLLVNQFWK